MIGQLKKIMVRELRSLFTDPRVITLLLAGPFFYMIVFGFVYVSGRASQVPVLIFDQDHSYLSRQVVQSLGASEGLKVAGYIDNLADFTTAARRGTAAACVVFPDKFETDLKAGKPAQSLVLIDGGNILIANVVFKSVRLVFADCRERYRTKIGPPLLRYEYRPLFNPAFNYDTFMLMGLAGAVIQQIFLIALLLAINLDAYSSRGRRYAGRLKPGWLLYAGKLGAYFLVTLPEGLLVIGLPFLMFGAGFRGDPLIVVVNTVIFIAIQVFCAWGLAALLEDPLPVMQTLLPLSTIFLLGAGFSWPLWAMPDWSRVVFACLPITYYLDIVRRVSLLDAGWPQVYGATLCLGLWLLIAIAWSWWGWKRLYPHS
jgi:ABC-2 type transport system permease protein